MVAEGVSLEPSQKTFSSVQLRKHTAKEPLRGMSLRQPHNHPEQLCGSSPERPGHVDGTVTVPSFPGNATARGVARSTLTQNPKHDQDQKSANKEDSGSHLWPQHWEASEALAQHWEAGEALAQH